MIYDRTMQAMEYIENLSDHDPRVCKVITTCSSLIIYAKDSQTSDPYLMMDEMTMTEPALLIKDHPLSQVARRTPTQEGIW